MTQAQSQSSTSSSTSTPQANAPKLGRNDVCHCGSGKKYKKCHEEQDLASARSSLASAPSPSASQTPGEGAPAGFDPSKLDPKWMEQLALAFKKLPKGQSQKLRSMMMKAMMGKDVSREAAELERILPPEFQKLLASDQAKQAAEGHFASLEAQRKGVEEAKAEKASKLGKFWGGIFGKKNENK